MKDSDGKIVEALGINTRTKKKMYDTSVEIGLINISKLPTGPYFFVHGISDSTGAVLAQKEKKFYVYNPAIPLSPIAQVETGVQADVEMFRELETMTNEELDREFEYMRYLTMKKDKEFYKQLTNPVVKRQIIYSIWRTKVGS